MPSGADSSGRPVNLPETSEKETAAERSVKGDYTAVSPTVAWGFEEQNPVHLSIQQQMKRYPMREKNAPYKKYKKYLKDFVTR